jgi:predicted negative regulator of RcsB-dependent stress response
MYADLKKALEASKPDEAAKIADKLQSDYASTPYATAAALRLAQVGVIDSKLDEAGARLDWVIKNGNDDGLKQLAKLRKARVLWQQGKADEAQKALDNDGGEFASLYSELRGDLALSQGDRSAARTHYEAALKASTEQAPNRPLLQQKLDDLAVETASVAAPAAEAKP